MLLDFTKKKTNLKIALNKVLMLDEWDLDCSAGEFPSRFPVCNYTECVNSDNLGYTQGYLNYKLPFAAELYTNDAEEIVLAVLLPEVAELEVEREIPATRSEDGRFTSVVTEIKSWDNSVLKMGMAYSGQCDDFDIIANYVEFLEAMGIVEFTSNVKNGSLFRLTDINGTDLVQILVTLLDEHQDVVATTPLHFHSFFTNEFDIV